MKKEVKNLGGRGKLTGKLIDDLSVYYGLAIRRNTDSVENMRKEIYATLFYKISTDEKPQHDRCPVGEKIFSTVASADLLKTPTKQFFHGSRSTSI